MDFEKIKEEVELLKSQGERGYWIILGEKYGRTPSAMESWFRRQKLGKQINELLEEDSDLDKEETQTEPEYRAKTETKFDDDGRVRYMSSDRLVRMSEEEQKTPEFVLRAHGFDPEKWVVVSIVNNFWQGLRPEDLGAATLYQSKLTVKPKTDNKTITLEDIEFFFKKFNLSNKQKEYSYNYFDYEDSGVTLVINLADMHFGNEEDGYPTRDKVSFLLNTVVDKSKGRHIKKFVVANVGDAIHVDTEGGTTTAGTQVGSRGTIYHYWEDALISLIDFVETLSKIAPVEYISISGNHDRVNGFTLSKSVEYALLKNNNVSFNTDFSHRKYFTVGSSMFGVTHGDMPSKNQGIVLQAEEREMFGNSKFAYLLMGHLHHINIKDDGNVMLCTLPSITSIDYWHNSQGYVGSWSGTFCYVVDDKYGIVETWHIPAKK